MSAREKFLKHWQAARAGAPVEGFSVQPYPGLRAFWQTETDLFFGRGRQIKDLLAGLDRRKVTFVLGGSGSGKSSLVRAGLLPRLSMAPVQPRVGAWYAVEFRPGEAPSAQLLEALVAQIVDPVLALEGANKSQRAFRHEALLKTFAIDRNALTNGASAITSEDLRVACRARLQELLFRGKVIDPAAVIAFATNQLATLDRLLSRRADATAPSLMMLIDQFEEVFGDEVSAEDRRMLISLIMEVWKKKPGTLYLIVTMRSEELHRCAEFEGLAEVINTSFYLVDLVGQDDLDDVIIGPARRILKSWELEDPDWTPTSCEPFSANAIATLKQTYLDSAQTASSADRLPLMQHLLSLVWDRAVERWAERRHSELLHIDVNDIQAVPGWLDKDGPLRGPLTTKADTVLSEAVAKAGASKEAQNGAFTVDARSLLHAAFCMLARQDDRGNPKRDFATQDEILLASGVADRERKARETDGASRAVLRLGLDFFRRAGLIDAFTEAGRDKYNVNHEAFIRGWRQYGDWLAHARRCEDRLIDVDEKLREAAASESQSGRSPIMEYVFASRLNWAAATITEDTASLLADVIGPNSTFSREWARGVLARNDAREAHLAARTL